MSRLRQQTRPDSRSRAVPLCRFSSGSDPEGGPRVGAECPSRRAAGASPPSPFPFSLFHFPLFPSTPNLLTPTDRQACINESSTSALLASTMMMGFGGGAHGADGGEAESASLLNEIDEFQRTVLGVVGELERRVGGDGGTSCSSCSSVLRAWANESLRVAENEQKPQQEQGRTVQKYMLHRSLTTGVDLFTSAAMLGEADLAELGGSAFPLFFFLFFFSLFPPFTPSLFSLPPLFDFNVYTFEVN